MHLGHYVGVIKKVHNALGKKSQWLEIGDKWKCFSFNGEQRTHPTLPKVWGSLICPISENKKYNLNILKSE